MEFKDLIKNRRNRLGKTLEDVAQVVGVSKTTVQRWESGNIKNLRRDKIAKLAEALHTTPGYLMGWEDDPNDWERIGNEEGIYPPKDYDGNYEEYVKYKVLQEQDDTINEYYDTYDRAIKYLKDVGCQVFDNHGDAITIITPSGEHLSANMNDLVHNFQLYGATHPGIKKLIAVHRTELLRLDEEELLRDYNKLNNSGQNEAQKRVQELTEVPKYLSVTPSRPIFVDFYRLPASAGTGMWLSDEIKECREVPNTPEARCADFAIPVVGDSMEPDYHGGDIVFVKSQPSIDEGEIGVFVLNNESYIKKLGKNSLISLNPRYSPIEFNINDSIFCAGKVIGKVQ